MILQLLFTCIIYKHKIITPAGYPCREFLNIFIQISKCLVRHVKVIEFYESIQLRNYPSCHKFNDTYSS